MVDGRPVLIVTQLDDPTADFVAAALQEREVTVVRFDTADFPEELTFTARIAANTTLVGELTTATRSVDLAAVRSLYYRRPTGFVFPGMSREDQHFAGVQARYGLGGVLASLSGCLYVNHPHRDADAEYKPSQLATAAAVGFSVPTTIITSNPQRARDFVAEVGSVVYKPLRSTSYQRDGRRMAIWTEEIDPAELDDSIRKTAHLFQAKVAKVADARVVVVGARVFSIRIDSDLLDWRCDYDRLSYQAISAPGRIVDMMVAYLHRMGLAFGVFDFGLTEDGGWFFFECNPNGQWAWLEKHTELPIADAFADLLQEGLAA